MALATRLDEYRLSYDQSKLDFHEHRMGNFGAFQTFYKDTPNLIPGYQLIQDNVVFPRARTNSIPVLARISPTAGTARTCSAATETGTSSFQNLSWSTYQSGFAIVPAEHDYDQIKMQVFFNQMMKAHARKALEVLDAAAYTVLNTYKAGYDPTGGYPFAFSANEYLVPAASWDDAFNQLKGILLANKLPVDMINVVSSPMVMPIVSKLFNQGNSNATNTQFQFNGYNFAYSNNLTIADGYRGSVFASPMGTLGFLFANNPDNIKGRVTSDGKEFRTVMIPELGFPVDVIYQSTCADVSSSRSITGGEAQVVESYSLSFDYAYMYAYESDNSSAKSRPIFKLSFSNS